MDNYETIVGMEIHVELKTVSKMFCGCKNDPFHAPKPNIYTCPVCLGLPGALPVPNKKAIEWTHLLGLALGCTIAPFSKFDRKNYFYPDLAKGYQISQYDQPLCVSGLVKTEFGDVRIHRVHLEEDTGKLLHRTVDGKKVTLIDFNRSGVPLVEIVTEPDIRSGDQAKAFLKKLYQIVRYIGISDADMEKGSMRLEPNISVRIQKTEDRRQNNDLPDYKVEVKNINSFNFVKKAIEYETQRHIKILELGKTPIQETRGWNEAKGETYSQRIKETADDYRYFPEPDIPPMRWDKNYISTIRNSLPELPEDKSKRFQQTYSLQNADAQSLIETRERADFFEQCMLEIKKRNSDIRPKKVANVCINKKVDISVTPPSQFIEELINLLNVETIPKDELDSILMKVINENEKAVMDFKNGKQQAIMFLMGKAKSIVKTADPQMLTTALKKLIQNQ